MPRGDAFEVYVERIRRGESDLYAAYRVYEHAYRLHDDRATARRAVVLLLENDPWFLVGAMPYFLDVALTGADVERLTPIVARGLPAGLAALVRARLWFYSNSIRSKPNRARLRKVQGRLSRVPCSHRGGDWFRMMGDTQRRLGDWDGYKRLFPRLYAATECGWRSVALRDVLEESARHKDFRTYDRWRRVVRDQPASAYTCECHKNTIANLDGLRAIAADRWDEVPQHLDKALDVAGCPHLNSGGLDLRLVEAAVKRKRCPEASRRYLERARSFGNTAAIDRLSARLGA
jgi:hypothetical protein